MVKNIITINIQETIQGLMQVIMDIEMFWVCDGS